MATLKEIIKVTSDQYAILESGGTISGHTGLDENTIYLIPGSGGGGGSADVTFVDWTSDGYEVTIQFTNCVGASSSNIFIATTNTPTGAHNDLSNILTTATGGANNNTITVTTTSNTLYLYIPTNGNSVAAGSLTETGGVSLTHGSAPVTVYINGASNGSGYLGTIAVNGSGSIVFNGYDWAD